MPPELPLPVLFDEQLEDQPYGVGVQRPISSVFLVLEPHCSAAAMRLADGRQRAVPEALPGVLLRLVFVEQAHDLVDRIVVPNVLPDTTSGISHLPSRFDSHQIATPCREADPLNQK
jgi:hypothetical protein